ncbi:MAG: domain containing protein [Bacteroidota bacterium]|nr:domain containing protein [Bacteroidota bacterium]
MFRYCVEKFMSRQKGSLLLAMIIYTLSTYASHIVGGEIYYKYQGNNTYNIKLFLYRDCSNPTNLLLEDSVVITAYKKFNTDDVKFQAYRQEIDTLPITLNNSCSQLPDVCVEKHTYTATITLPPSASGWSVFFSTCCRNATVGNIESPGNTGASYLVNIPPANQLVTGFGNSEFKSFPPIAICVGKPVSFDNSIHLNPGDSVSYSLYTPIDVVDSNSNNEFVFHPILWRLPYSEADMLGGTTLTINPGTGFLSGTPNTIGQFLVGVHAMIFRNGTLVAETRRDFQFNVTDCFDQIGFTFTKTCGSTTVSFTNRTVGHHTFTWTYGDGATQTGIVNPSHTYPGFGTYTVTLHTDSVAGCPSTFTQTITLGNDKPIANFAIGNFSDCLGKNDTIRLTDLSIDTITFPIVSWQWSVNGRLLSYDKNAIYYFDPSDAFFFSTVYIKLVIKNLNGCTDSLTKTIPVRGMKPEYTLVHDYSICQIGNQQGIHVDLSYDPFDFLSFKWTPATGVSNTNIADPDITVSQPATYYVTITRTINNITCSTVDSIRISFQKPDIYVPRDTTSFCGIPSMLITPVGDSTLYSIQWSDVSDFSNIVSNNNSIIINKPLSTNAVTYYYHADFGSGCTYSDSVKITFITGAPAIQLADSFFFCSRNINIPATITPTAAVEWSTSRNFSTILSTNNPLVITQTQNSLKYYLRTGSGLCIAVDSITVSTTDPITSKLVRDTFICGNKILMKADLTGITVRSVQWSYNNNFIPVFATTDTTTVTKTGAATRQVFILVTAINGCTAVDSAIITFNDVAPVIMLTDDTTSCSNRVSLAANVIPLLPVEWSANAGFIPVLSTSTTLNIIQNSKTAVYYIRVTNNGCPAIDSVKVTIPDTFPQIQLDDLVSVCNDTVRLHPVLTNVNSVQWSLDRNFNIILSTHPDLHIAQTAPAVTYYLKAFYENCPVTDSVLVLYNNILPDIVLADSISLCDNFVNTFAAVQNFDSILWYTDGSMINVISHGSTLQISQAQYISTYYIKAFYNGCTANDSITILNNKIEYSKVNIAVCKNDPVDVQLNILSPIAYIVDWKFHDSTFSTNAGNIQLNAQHSGILIFTISNGSCRIADSILITVNDNPGVNALADKDSIQKGEQVQLSTNPSVGFTFNWSPQNLLSNPVITNPTSSPTETTTFIVRVTDQNGCGASDSVTVRVYNSGCSNIYIPNAFTPNGDHVNDMFRARSAGVKNMRLIVFNRLGEKIFETTDPGAGWDGTYKDQPAPEDSYGYYFSAECLQEEKIILKGNVTLLR